MTRIIAIVLACVLATGCVTVNDRRVDPARAVSTHIQAGLEYLRMGQPNNARRHLAKALEINKKSPEAHNAMALLYRYEQDDEHEEYHYKRALHYDSDFAPAHNNYGIFLVRQKRYDEALKQFYKAANNQSYDNRALVYENIARIYAIQGDKDQAIENFNKSLRLTSRPNIDVYLEMADLYFLNGDIKHADFYYSNYAQQVNPLSARALWLGIRIAAKLHQADRVASYELALKNLYPKSQEYQQWQQWRRSDS